MVPPHGLLFREYKPDLHGPLVPCFYDTAAYLLKECKGWIL